MSFPVKSNKQLLTDLKSLKDRYDRMLKQHEKEKYEFIQASQRFRESEDRYRGIFESALDGILLTAPDGRILAANPAACRMFQYTEDELIRIGRGGLTDQSDPDFIRALEVREATGMFTGQYNAIRKSGEIFPVEASSVIFKDKNGNERTSLILREITLRRKAEQTIEQQAKDLQKLSTDKDLFISILAHDLKDPFNSILGIIDHLSQNLGSYSIDEIEEEIDLINNSATHTYNLLEEILSWISAQAGNVAYKPDILSLKEISSAVLQNLTGAAHKKHIDISNELMVDAVVHADVNMLKTIFRNLITNAIKFTNEGGWIKISAKKVDSVVEISVIDNGIGIENERLSQLFEISKISSMRGTSNERGTGLGLVLCKELLNIQHGNLYVESQPGKGSIFKFSLPC